MVRSYNPVMTVRLKKFTFNNPLKIIQPSSFGDDHLRPEFVEVLPEFAVQKPSPHPPALQHCMGSEVRLILKQLNIVFIHAK